MRKRLFNISSLIIVYVLLAFITGCSRTPVKELIKDLGSEDEGVRTRAKSALVKVGTPAVVHLIVALKDENERTRTGAALALGELKDPRAIKPLKAVLEDEHPSVQKAAKSALEQF